MNKKYRIAFKNQLDNFICDFKSVCSSDKLKSLCDYENKINALYSANPQKLIELFGEYVIPYKQKIMEKDETFFLNKNDYDKDFDEDDMSMFENFHMEELWHTFDQNTKNNIFKYFNILIILYEKI
jgi:hypothetical protein